VASAEFQTLLAVQDHDTAIDRLVHRRETLPERATRLELLERGQKRAAERDEVAVRRDEVVGRQTGLETELETSEARITQVDKRLYSGEVSASRDLQAMAEEIERLKEYCSKLEDRVLATMDERQPLDDQVAALEAELHAIADEVAAVDAAIRAHEAEIDAELATERAAREDLAAGIPEALLARYSQIRTKLGGIGAAPLNGHSCGGCHLVLPATEVDRIRHEPPDALILCDQCGRILVRQS